MKSISEINLPLKLPPFAAEFGTLTTQATGHGTIPEVTDGGPQQKHPARLSLPKTRGLSDAGFYTRTTPWSDHRTQLEIQPRPLPATDRPGLANV